MRIGEVAAETGLEPSAIRYHETNDIIPQPERTKSGLPRLRRHRRRTPLIRPASAIPGISTGRHPRDRGSAHQRRSAVLHCA